MSTHNRMRKVGEVMSSTSSDVDSSLAGYVVSYAQNREDRIIEGFFPDIESGTYVDVGANEPEDDSVTKIFYDKGWSGINIEPSPRLYVKLKNERKRDTNVNLGVSEKSGTLTFREYKNHGLSTFSQDVKAEHEKQVSEKTSEYQDYDVAVLPLKDILKKHLKNDHIHFMKIDVEGYEYNVIKGNDWTVFRPELLCIEANHVIKEWRTLLTQAKYTLALNDGLNEYYLREESLFRQKYFDYSNTMLLSGVMINPGVAKRIMIGQEDRQNLENYSSIIGKLEAKNNELNVKYSNAILELNQKKNIKKQIKNLYDSMDQKILSTIERKGRSHGRKKTSLSVDVDTMKNSASFKDLLESAKKYDAKSFYNYHAIKNPKKIHYRIIEGVYKTSRNIVFKGLKSSYKTIKKVRGVNNEE